MKSYTYFFICVFTTLLLSSCAVPHYQHTYESSKGLDLRKGKWLVNHIEYDLSLRSEDALAMQLAKEFIHKGLSLQLVVMRVIVRSILQNRLQV